jgi:hypothetical protein
MQQINHETHPVIFYSYIAANTTERGGFRIAVKICLRRSTAYQDIHYSNVPLNRSVRPYTSDRAK